MKYQPQNLRFSLEQRRMLNEKVLYLIDSHSCAQYDITGDDIFNAYTGIGGLHGLSREDFDNYHEYSEQKKILIPHLHSVHNGSRIRHLHERGDADGTAQENRIEAENSVG